MTLNRPPDRLLSEEFPGAHDWGISGTVANAPNRWACPGCGRFDRLLVRNAAGEIMFHDCFHCWYARSTQLNLFR